MLTFLEGPSFKLKGYVLDMLRLLIFITSLFFNHCPAHAGGGKNYFYGLISKSDFLHKSVKMKNY